MMTKLGALLQVTNALVASASTPGPKTIVTENFATVMDRSVGVKDGSDPIVQDVAQGQSQKSGGDESKVSTGVDTLVAEQPVKGDDTKTGYPVIPVDPISGQTGLQHAATQAHSAPSGTHANPSSMISVHRAEPASKESSAPTRLTGPSTLMAVDQTAAPMLASTVGTVQPPPAAPTTGEGVAPLKTDTVVPAAVKEPALSSVETVGTVGKPTPQKIDPRPGDAGRPLRKAAISSTRAIDRMARLNPPVSSNPVAAAPADTIPSPRESTAPGAVVRLESGQPASQMSGKTVQAPSSSTRAPLGPGLQSNSQQHAGQTIDPVVIAPEMNSTSLSTDSSLPVADLHEAMGVKDETKSDETKSLSIGQVSSPLELGTLVFSVHAPVSISRAASGNQGDPGTSTQRPAAINQGAEIAPASRGQELQHSTLQAGPTSLEVGVVSGTHGWLKVRAEMTPSGVSASLSGTSRAATDSLRGDLPALTAFLEREHVAVTSLAVSAAVSVMAAPTEQLPSAPVLDRSAELAQFGFSSDSQTGPGTGQGQPEADRPAASISSEAERFGKVRALPMGYVEGLDGKRFSSSMVYGSGGSWLNVRV